MVEPYLFSPVHLHDIICNRDNFIFRSWIQRNLLSLEEKKLFEERTE
jgi:hypothetical protein